MTNKEDSAMANDNNPSMAAVLAMRLVSQVLDEAYIIANAAKDSGQPWQNLSIMKSFKTSRLSEIEVDESSIEASKGDCEVNENKSEIVANIVATSTPEKIAARFACTDKADVSESIIIHGDYPFIGQGDEDNEAQQIELAKSTSMFINHLFDMSDVERIVVCDDTEIIDSTSEPNVLIVDAMNKILESHDANRTIPLEAFPLISNVEIVDGAVVDLPISKNSDYSLMADAFAAMDINRDIAFYIDDYNSREKRDVNEMYQPAVVEEIAEVAIAQINEIKKDNTDHNNDISYEDAYATLNRDYDQGSDEDENTQLAYPKAVTLQEVELMTADTTDDELASYELQKQLEPNEIAPTDSGASGSRKSTLSRRCRIQGARLLACIRGWWRRKTPGKSKDFCGPGNVIGMCPLSPDARRRASSLLDNRLLRSPSPCRAVIWKFNTVNESLVNSNYWKEYTFDPKSEGCAEAGKF